MSKAVKNIIMRDYKARIKNPADDTAFHDAVLISIRGVKGVDNTKLRGTLAKKNIKVTVIRNSLAKKTFEGSALASLNDMLTGSSALAYGGQSVVEVARELVAAITKMPKVELKGAILDGTVYKGKEGVEELSRFPTREEAVAKVVTLVVSPGRNLMGQIKGPGATIAGIIKAIETKLEKGEAISKK
jgi:large subunit ribosomal protein L10